MTSFIIVLGHQETHPDYGADLVERMRLALEVRADRLARGEKDIRFVVSGGPVDPDSTITDAARMARFLFRNGVPGGSVIQENESTDLAVAAYNCARLIEDRPGRSEVVVIATRRDMPTMRPAFQWVFGVHSGLTFYGARRMGIRPVPVEYRAVPSSLLYAARPGDLDAIQEALVDHYFGEPEPEPEVEAELDLLDGLPPAPEPEPVPHAI